MLTTLREILPDAQKNGYAVGLFNTVNLEMLRAVLKAAEAEKSPVIIGTAQVLFPYGPLELLAAPLLDQARKAKVPVVVHLDHGLSFDTVIRALGLGFSSVMFDGSTLPYEENVGQTREIVRIAHLLGASVEAELGHVGEAADGAKSEGGAYTDPKQAKDFADRTGVDALAVAVGTAHGQYRVKPRLDIGRLRSIRSLVGTPLVLHGGSGLSDDDFRSCIRSGVAKVNIFTDLTIAAKQAADEGLAAGATYLDLTDRVTEGICREVRKKMRLFGCNGRA